MTDYRAQYKISQDAIVKYADDVRKLETEIKEKEKIIKNLKNVVDKDVSPKKRVGIEEMKKDMLKMMDKIDKLEDAFKYLKQRVSRLDGKS